MTTQPAPDDQNLVPPPARPPNRLWRMIAIAFAVLLGACGYFLVTLGPAVALVDPRFGYFAGAAAVLGICLLGRWMMRPLREGILLDRRNARLMRSPRANWMTWTGRDR